MNPAVKLGPRAKGVVVRAQVAAIVADLASGSYLLKEIALRHGVRASFVTAVAVVSGKGTELTRLRGTEVMVRRAMAENVAKGWRGTHWGEAIGRSQRYELGRAWRLWFIS